MAKSLIIKDGRVQQLAAPDYLELNRAFDVRDYGAVLNGTTNDAAALQAAQDAAKAAAGGIIYIPKGKLRLSSATNLVPEAARQGSYVICGEGSASKILLKDLGATYAFNFGNCNTVKFKNLAIVGDSAAGVSTNTFDSLNFILHCDYTHTITFENCLFLGIATSVSGISEGMFKFGNTVAYFKNCVFGACTATNSAVINMSGGRGVVMSNVLFLDYQDLDGVYYNKLSLVGSTKHWIRCVNPLNLSGMDVMPSMLTLRDTRFDENTADSLISVTGSGEHTVIVENSNFATGVGGLPTMKLNSLRRVSLRNVMVGYSGYTTPHLTEIFTDVKEISLDNLLHKYGASEMQLLGTTERLQMQNCSGINITNTAGAAVKTNDGPFIRSIASSATPTPNANDGQFNITALAAAATLGAPAGTLVDGKELKIRIKDNGAAARTLAYNSIYRSIGVTLPTTTVIGKTIYLGGIYNAADAKLDVVAVSIQA